MKSNDSMAFTMAHIQPSGNPIPCRTPARTAYAAACMLLTRLVKRETLRDAFFL